MSFVNVDQARAYRREWKRAKRAAEREARIDFGPVVAIPRERCRVRVLHPGDRRREAVRAFNAGESRPPFTLDGVIEVTLARVDAMSETPGERVIDWRGMR